MKKILTITAIAASIISCNKDRHDDSTDHKKKPEVISLLPKEIQTLDEKGNLVSTRFLKYNAKKELELVQKKMGNNPIVDELKYTYNTNGLVSKIENMEINQTIEYKYINGKLGAQIFKNNGLNDEQYDYTYTDNTIIRKKANTTESKVFTIINGNISKEEEKRNDATIFEVTYTHSDAFSYYKDIKGFSGVLLTTDYLYDKVSINNITFDKNIFENKIYKDNMQSVKNKIEKNDKGYPVKITKMITNNQGKTTTEVLKIVY